MIELKITKVPAMTPEGRFSLAPEDVESIRMQVLKADVRNTLESYADTFGNFDDEESKRLRQAVLKIISDDALLNTFIRKMDDGTSWSMSDLVLCWDSPMHDWDYAPAEENAVKAVIDDIS